MSGQGGPHPWTKDAPAMTYQDVTVAITDKVVFVTRETDKGVIVTTLDRSTLRPVGSE